MNMERIFVPFSLEVKAADVADNKPPGYFRGYGATFGNKDLGGDVILPGAFDATVAEHLAAGTVPAMCYEHNPTEPIGDYLTMAVDKKGLLLEGQLWVGSNIGRADQAYKMLQSKTCKGLSIGYSHITAPTYDDKKKTRNLTSLRVHEISPVGSPMNPKAQVVTIKSMLAENKILTVRDAEDFLRDAGGFSASEAKTFIAALKSGFVAERDASHERAQVIESALKTLRTLQQ
jgi:HK97 family phage prohead protease